MAVWLGNETVVPTWWSRVHILFCDTRSSLNGSGTLLAQSIERASALQTGHTDVAGNRPTITNICAGREWRSDWMLKFSALAAWTKARADLAADDVLIVIDTDVVANGGSVLSSAALLRRFHEARGARRIVYQAEPICWAEFGHSKTLFRKEGCSRDVLRAWNEVPATRDADPTCARFLCGGAFAGFAHDVRQFLTRMAALREANAKVASPRDRLCYFEPGEKKLSDQCLATHVLLAESEWLGLDYREALFAYAGSVARPFEANAIKGAPCGNVSCRMSAKFGWSAPPKALAEPEGLAQGGRFPRHSGGWNAAVGEGFTFVDGGQAQAVPWLERPAEQQWRCHLRAGGPAFLHFNGPPKTLLLPQARLVWQSQEQQQQQQQQRQRRRERHQG